MSDTWFMGDTHLGHANIITFKDNDGNRIRPFDSIEAHDAALIDNFNALVKPEDRVYFLGDLAFNRTNLAKIHLFNGRKKLIKGNHDILKLKEYINVGFEDVSAYRIYPDHGLIFSHIPVHPSQLERRFKFNIHGHGHANDTPKYHGSQKCIREDGHPEPDLRYINLCPEKTGFKPVNFKWILEECERRSKLL